MSHHLAWAGELAPEATKDAQQMWVQDTVHYAKEQGIDLGELGKQILLSMGEEFGYWKIILTFSTVVVVGIGLTVWRVMATIKKRSG